MLPLNGWIVAKIGDGTRNFQNTVIGAGAKSKLRDGNPQQFLGILLNLAELAEVLGFHIRVTVDRRLSETLLLDTARGLHTFPNIR